MFRKALTGVLIVAVIIVASALATFLWLRSSLPTTNGTVSLDGLLAPVEVIRDEHAVPHIFANNDHNAYFALGYIHAQDRLWQMELSRRAGRGTLAELLGKKALDTDIRPRTLGFYVSSTRSSTIHLKRLRRRLRPTQPV